MKNKKTTVLWIFIYVWLVVLLVAVLFPLVYTIAASFKTNSEIMAHPERIFPENPTFDNYIQAWDSKNFNLKSMLFNSTVFTVVSVCITLFTSSLCGYVFARGRFPGKKIVFAVFSALMFVSLGSITMYPYFELLEFLHIEKSLYSLLFIRLFAIPTANIYLIRGFINTLPKELDEAATIDGCGFVRIFVYILFPLLKPILAVIGLMAFQGSWNEYLMPMIFTMTKPEQKTLITGVVALKSSAQAAAAWNLMLAGSTISLIPVLVAYAFGSKYFVQGITDGAVKG